MVRGAGQRERRPTIRFPRPPRSRRLGRLCAILGLPLALGVVFTACAPSDPPVRSPLEDTATVAPDAGTPRPLPTFTPPPNDSTPGPTPSPDAASDEERVAGQAITHLAEWTGVPETDIAFESIEDVEWPSACLGVNVPGFACAEVITPGYRVNLSIAGSPQTVHVSDARNYVWAPAFEATGRVIAEIDEANGLVVLEELPGSDEMGRRHRVVPGSYLELPLADLEPGDTVALAVSYALPEDDAAPIVWLVPAPVQ